MNNYNPPKWLSKRAKKIFKTIPVESETDLAQAALLASAVESLEVLASEFSKASRNVLRCAGLLGITPRARAEKAGKK